MAQAFCARQVAQDRLAAAGESERASVGLFVEPILLKVIKDLEPLLHLDPAKQEHAGCQAVLGHAYVAIGYNEKAAEAFRQALRGLEPDTREHLEVLLHLARIANESWQRQAALEFYDEVIKSCTSALWPDLLAAAYMERASIYSVLDRRSLAIADLGQAAQLWEHLEDRERMVQALWQKERLTGSIDPDVLTMLSGIDPKVSQKMLEMHRANVMRPAGRQRQGDKDYLWRLRRKAEQEIANLQEG